jgi:hypothetical protein
LTVSRSQAAALAVATVVFVLAGCGGGDESSTTSSAGSTTTAADVTEPSQPLSDQIPLFERAAASGDCDDQLEVVHPVQLADPEHPASPRNCEGANVMRFEKGVEVTDSQEFGTGAIVDTVVKDRQEALLWALDASGRFKWPGAFIHKLQVGTEARDPTRFAKPAQEFVDALRDGDCHAAYALLAQPSRLAQNDEDGFCQVFKPNFETAPEGLAVRLRKDPGAQPELLGATRDVAFFALATEPAGYRTMIVGVPSPGDAPLVIDVVPVER